MVYQKTNWTNTVYDDEGKVLQKGTPLMAENMEKIEQGIVDNETDISSIENSKGQSNGLATLDSDGKIHDIQIPSTLKEIEIVSTIAERDALEKTVKLRVLVTDASDDTTVGSGWAEYIWNGTEFLKLAEAESLDVSLSWGNIKGKPSSFQPVGHSHSETDITDLDKYTKKQVDDKLNLKSNSGHRHSEFADFADHEDRISDIETSSSDFHKHNNKLAIDKVRYSGSNPTVDLIELDELKNHTHEYSKLTGKPSIPSKTSDIENDSNYISGNVGTITVSATEPINPSENDIWIVI